jgi:hypothetical protein
MVAFFPLPQKERVTEQPIMKILLAYKASIKKLSERAITIE